MTSFQPWEMVQLKRASEPFRAVTFLGPSMISLLDPQAERQPGLQVVRGWLYRSQLYTVALLCTSRDHPMAQTPCPAGPNTRAPSRSGDASGQEAMGTGNHSPPFHTPNSTVYGKSQQDWGWGEQCPSSRGNIPWSIWPQPVQRATTSPILLLQVSSSASLWSGNFPPIEMGKTDDFHLWDFKAQSGEWKEVSLCTENRDPSLPWSWSTTPPPSTFRTDLSLRQVFSKDEKRPMWETQRGKIHRRMLESRIPQQEHSREAFTAS